MSTEIEFRFEDDVSLKAGVEDGQTVLDAALAAGINLMHQCRSGSCASCICTVTKGADVPVGGRASSLLKSEFEAGMRLSCSILAATDLVVELPYPYELTQGPAPIEAKAEVRAVRKLSSSVWLLSLELSDPFDFTAGQYVRIRVPGSEAWRSYSIASQPGDLPKIDLLIKERDGGLMTSALSDLQHGEHLEVTGPYGAFTVRKHPGDFLLVAGGTGLAPILSILDALREAPGKRPQIQLTFACSYESELFFLDELELREQWMPNLKLTVGVSRPSDSWSGARGNPLALVDPARIGPSTMVFVCGAPGLVEATREFCLRHGVDPKNVVAEQYVAESVDSGS